MLKVVAIDSAPKKMENYYSSRVNRQEPHVELNGIKSPEFLSSLWRPNKCILGQTS